MALVLQLKSTDLALSNLDPVDDWPNAQAITVEQLTAGERPIYRTNILNGFPGVVFDGTNDGMTIDLNISSEPFFIVVLYGTTFDGTADRKIIQGSNDWYIGTSATGFYRARNGSTIDGVDHVRGGRYYIHSAKCDSSGLVQRLNGLFAGRNSATLAPGTLGLGAEGLSSNPAQSVIIEVRVYDHAPTFEEEIGIIKAIGDTYGLTMPHIGADNAKYCYDFFNDDILNGPPPSWLIDMPGTNATRWEVYQESTRRVLRRLTPATFANTASGVFSKLRFAPVGIKADVEVLALLRRDVDNVCGIMLRDNTPRHSGIAVTLDPSVVGVKKLTGALWIPNTFAALFTSVNGTWYWLKARIIGSLLEVYAWEEGDPVPVVPLISETLDVTWSTEGVVGLIDGNVLTRYSCAHFAVATDGLEADMTCPINPPNKPVLGVVVDPNTGDATLTGTPF